MHFLAIPSPHTHAPTRFTFQDLPYNVFLLLAEYTPVREILLLGTLNRFFHSFAMPDNLALWTHFAERVCLLHPPTLRRTLFNESLLRMYAAVNSLPITLFSSWGEKHMDTNYGDESTLSREMSRWTISQKCLLQWVTDCSEEVIEDLRMFSDIINREEARFAITGLLLALHAVKKRMWCTEVMDQESVRDLLRSTIVEDEHDQGWSVFRTIAGSGKNTPKRFFVTLSLSVQSGDITALSTERQIMKKRLKRAAVVAREYLQLREVLHVLLAVSEVSDHPNAQQRYDSVWSALCGTSAMLHAEKNLQENQSGDLGEVTAAIPISTAGDELLQQIRDLNKVTVGGIVSYFFGYVSGKVQRKAFLSALFSMKHLAGAERYENVPFW
ncbi:hypothetical protein LSM04_007272 [Trypanosoma melophagium]|uniref:uncharacterized protein n=1 Tax=Trypanosoma melophagium TaxID=715481 RepID=UPI00351A023A|nr:hypothetical protein LSM04_007272 [Trypanosoma melophagium]